MKKYDTRKIIDEKQEALAKIFQYKNELRKMSPIISKEDKEKEKKLEKEITKLYLKTGYKRDK